MSQISSKMKEMVRTSNDLMNWEFCVVYTQKSTAAQTEFINNKATFQGGRVSKHLVFRCTGQKVTELTGEGYEGNS